ncbi:hypothetical protein D4S03_11185 [bacterium]|nr:MAG: hypothetical protein D4S03_11185 [bacterium]
MGKKVAILQSNYIPWKGYVDLINYVDEFIIYDTVQFTKNDWRNRNKIKTPRGINWLTIPVEHRFGQLIKDTQVSQTHWAHKHWFSLVESYAKATYFKQYQPTFERLYQEAAKESHLSLINYLFLTKICCLLNIRTKISWSHDYYLCDGKTERLVDLCQRVGANEYISGPSAKNYIDSNIFAEANIKLTYINYSGYPSYRQLFGPFEHGVSILDLIFNEGNNAQQYMKSFLGCAPDQPLQGVN